MWGVQSQVAESNCVSQIAGNAVTVLISFGSSPTQAGFPCVNVNQKAFILA